MGGLLHKSGGYSQGTPQNGRSGTNPSQIIYRRVGVSGWYQDGMPYGLVVHLVPRECLGSYHPAALHRLFVPCSSNKWKEHTEHTHIPVYIMYVQPTLVSIFLDM